MCNNCMLPGRQNVWGRDGNGQGGIFKESFRGRPILQICTLHGVNMFKENVLRGAVKVDIYSIRNSMGVTLGFIIFSNFALS